MNTFREAAWRAALTHTAPQPASETASLLPFSAKTLMASRDSQQSYIIFMGTWQATMVASSSTWSRLGSSLGMP